MQIDHRARGNPIEPNAAEADADTHERSHAQASLAPWAALARERVRARLTNTPAHPVEVAGYVVERVIGEGGMGIVYAAHHAVTRQRVALKMLREGDVDRSRLQHEFRAAADLAHRNLVSLYELHAHRHALCITMELIDGVPLLEFLRGDAATPGAAVPFDRLYACLLQLCDALSYLHARSHVHGDIKPLNCLVEAGGRLVLLDFGLACLDDGSLLQGGRSAGGGTPAYMAPELFEGAPPSPASDLYALGALLHHVLARRPPFEVCGKDGLLAAKRRGAPAWTPAPALTAIPEELLELRRSLLCADPRERPDLSSVIRTLAALAGETARAPAAFHDSATSVPFVGRRVELERMGAALERARQARCCMVVEGRSGVGKSALVRRFLSHHAPEHALVLRSRCHERESVPYQAFEGIVEQLAAHLAALPRDERQALLPPEAALLGRLFPVLRTLLDGDGRDGQPFSVADSAARRKDAARALFALLHAVARTRPTLIWIDDLQWADQDSRSFLREWLASEDSAPLLLVCSFRSEAWSRGGALPAVFPEGPGSAAIAVHLHLQALSESEAGELRGLLGADATRVPLALAVHTLESLHEVVADRLAALSAGASILLQTIAVARGPLPIAVAVDAADAQARWRELLTELRSCQLLRTDGPGQHDTAEVFHDRLRDEICGRLDPASTTVLHARIAHALLAAGGEDEALYFHFRCAGEGERALRHGEAAVDKAAAALAFERAAELAAELVQLAAEPAQRRRLQRKLGDVLQNGGHGQQAAAAYLAACEGETEQDAALDLRLLAAKELLYTGCLPEAEQLFASLFRDLGVYFPRGAHDALPCLVAARAKIAWLQRKPMQVRTGVAKSALVRMRACWAAAQGMYMVDVMRGSKLASDVLVEALRSGDAYNLAGSYSVEAVNVALRGPDRRQQVQALQQIARSAADHVQDPYIGLWLDLMQATAAIALGDLHEGVACCRAVERALVEQHVGLWGELSMCRNLLVDSLCLLGEFAEVGRRVPAILERAQARGHVYDSVMMRSATTLLCLAADRPDDAERELAVIDRLWPGTGYQLAHHRRAFGAVCCLLYRGDGGRAFEAIEQLWPRFRRSLWSLVGPESLLAWTVRGNAAVAALQQSGSTRARRVARRAQRALDGMGYPTARPTALAIEAALARIDGRLAEAERDYGRAVADLGETARPLQAAALKLRQAALLPGAEAVALRASAWSVFERQGVRDPEAFGRLYVP